MQLEAFVTSPPVFDLFILFGYHVLLLLSLLPPLFIRTLAYIEYPGCRSLISVVIPAAPSPRPSYSFPLFLSSISSCGF